MPPGILTLTCEAVVIPSGETRRRCFWRAQRVLGLRCERSRLVVEESLFDVPVIEGLAFENTTARVNRGIEGGLYGGIELKIGILAVQGDFEAHAEMLARLGVEHCFVKTPQDLQACDALILPGGESTTQLQFLQDEGLIGEIQALAARGGAFFGTCAGAILLAREVHNPPQASLGLLDISIARNAYGRQLSSEVRFGTSKLASASASQRVLPEPQPPSHQQTPAPQTQSASLEMVFIRAPIIQSVGPGVEILAESEGKPVLVRQGRILAATFHPELTADPTVHAAFVKMVSGRNGRAVTQQRVPPELQVRR